MSYHVADDYGWEDARTFSEAVEMAKSRDRVSEEPVDIYELIDWRSCLTPQERGEGTAA